jgi:hypothetical protein
MKKIILIALLFNSITFLIKAQNNSIDKIQGKWVGYITSQSSTMAYYRIISENSQLSLSFDSTKLVNIGVIKVGFINYQKDTILENEFEKNGKNFFIGKKYKDKIVGKVIENFDLQNLTYYYGTTSIYEFYKVDTLPLFVYTEILKWDSLYTTSFSNQFISLGEKQVNVSKSFIYLNPSVKSKSFLIKGDKIIVVEEIGDWYKFCFKGNKIIGGWIKKSDIIIGSK